MGGYGNLISDATGVAGELAGTVGVNIPGVTLGGTLKVQLNTRPTAVNVTFAGAGGSPVTVNLPAGPFVRVEGTNLQLAILGQTLSGDVVFQQTNDPAHPGQKVVYLGAANVALSLGGGLVTASGGQADLLLSAGGLAGKLSATVAVNVPNVTLSGTLTVEINNTGLAVNQAFEVGGQPRTLMLDAGQYVRVVGQNVRISIAGQELNADVSLEKGTDASGASVVKVAIENSDGATTSLLKLGPPGTPFIDVKDGNGQFLITSMGVAGSVNVTDSSVTIPGFTLHPGNLTVQVNTIPTAVHETFLIGGAMRVLDLPAGPFVRVTAIGLTVTIAGQDLQGDFLFDQQGQPDGSTLTRIAVANVMVGVDIGGDGAMLTEGEGAFVILNSGVAGVISGKLDAAVGGLDLGARVLLRINQTGHAVDQTIELNGRSLAIRFGEEEGNVFAVSLSDLTLNIGDFVTIEGNVSFVNQPGRQVFAGDHLSIFLGQGPARLANGEINPLAVGVLLSDAQIGLIKITGATTTYALNASGTVQLLGIPGVTISGTAHVLVNTTGMPIDQTLTIPGGSGPGIPIQFATGDRVTRFEALNATLSLLGQTLTGNFAFDQVATGTDPNAPKTIRIAASGIGLSLGGGAIAVSNGQGSLIVTGNGLAGQFEATVQTDITGVAFSGTFGIAINTTTAAVNQALTVGDQTITLDLPAGPFLRVSGQGVSLTVLGQTLSGDFAFEKATRPDGQTVIIVAASNVSLDLAGQVQMSNGQGTFVLAVGGLAGRLSGDVTIAAAGFSGSFSVAINTTFQAVQREHQRRRDVPDDRPAARPVPAG